MSGRRCAATTGRGVPCRAFAVRDSDFCFHHAPERREEAAEARRLGGLRRRKERALGTIYAIADLSTLEDIRRLLQIAAQDSLALTNTWDRNRTLNQIAQTALKVQEAKEQEARITLLERRLAAGD